MVEPAFDDAELRALTPTPRRSDFARASRQSPEESLSNSPTPTSSPVSNDFLFLPTHQSTHQPLDLRGSAQFSTTSMGDAREDSQQYPPMSDNLEGGSTRRGTRSRSHHTQGSQFSQPTTYSVSSPPGSNDNLHGAAFQGSVPHYHSTGVSYGHPSGYVAQSYTVPTQSTMRISHTPPPYGSYSFHPGVPESSVMPQGVHARYHPMLQPHPPIFYQRQSSEGASSNQSSPLYHQHQVPGTSASGQPLSSAPTGPTSAHSGSYVGAAPYQYQSPHSTQRFPYQPQSFSTSPSIYHPYPTHQTYPPPDPDQGTWYYLPHTLQQYGDGRPVPYQGHYPMTYPSMGHPEVEPSYPTLSPSGMVPQGSGGYTTQESQETKPDARPTTTDHRSTRAPLVQSPGLGTSSARKDDPSGGGGGGPASSSGSAKHERSMARKAYHPNPPPDRSEWVMWVGNVPSDATHDELWKFFTSPSAIAGEGASSLGTVGPKSGTEAVTGVGTSPGQDHPHDSGVVSIFLISRSSCVFVNYQTEEHLNQAIEQFNGSQLRPHNVKGLRLVCRVRRRDDDLKAGVGGQRGQGLHTRWVRDKKLKERRERSSSGASTSSSVLESHPHRVSAGSAGDPVDMLSLRTSDLSMSGDEERQRNAQASRLSSSGSYTSTDSSLIAAHFPQRYFILKSLTQYDLDLSVQQGLWATQKHNEGILDQAYRNCKTVYLIFGVNKSGGFYGYARMAGAVQRGERNVPWASRGKETSRPVQLAQSGYFWPDDERAVEDSPLPVDASGGITDVKAGDARARGSALLIARAAGPNIALSSAPADLEQAHRPISRHVPGVKSTTMLEQTDTGQEFELDPKAPLRAMRPKPHGTSAEADMGQPSRMVEEEKEKTEGGSGDDPGSDHNSPEETWGDCFKVEWLCTERLPFYWTRDLRNPWNHDREVKVSRDGTELEPTIGQMLLDAWNTMRAEGGQVPLSTVGSNRASRSGGQPRRHPGAGKPEGENTEKRPSRS